MDHKSAKEKRRLEELHKPTDFQLALRDVLTGIAEKNQMVQDQLKILDDWLLTQNDESKV